MNSQTMANAIQIATGVALLVGVVLVIVELQQAKALTLAELTSAGYSEALHDYRTLMGEDSASVVSKSCHDPENLTQTELVILDAFFRAQISEVSRLRVLEQVADFGAPWKNVATQQLVTILSTAHGRWWYAEHLQGDEEIAAIAEPILATNPNCADYFNRFAAATLIDK